MARCPRCNGCRSMWEIDNCFYCNFPGNDSRSEEEIKEDQLDKENKDEY